MATNQISKSEWKTYLDQASKHTGNTEVEIEVSSLKMGNQIAARSAPLHGLNYDPKEDTFSVFVEGLEHMIHHPQAIYVEEDGEILQSMEILGDEDTRHILRFRMH